MNAPADDWIVLVLVVVPFVVGLVLGVFGMGVRCG